MIEGHKAYVAEITEYEWGCRPDGYAVCLDKEIGKVWATKDKGHVCRFEGGYCSAGDFKLCIINENGLEAIQRSSKGVFWIDRSDFSTYILEV